MHLKLGLTQGRALDLRPSRPGDEAGKATYPLGPTKEATILAGTYKPLRADTEVKFKARVVPMTYWYAAGVGLEKLAGATGMAK